MNIEEGNDIYINNAWVSEIEVIDSNSQIINNVPQCDFIVEISWRYLISQEIVKQASTLTFGVHRGKLPEYAGSEPIKQALEKNESKIVLTTTGPADLVGTRYFEIMAGILNWVGSRNLKQRIGAGMKENLIPGLFLYTICLYVR